MKSLERLISCMIAELSDHASEYSDAQFQQEIDWIWNSYNINVHKCKPETANAAWQLARTATNYILAAWNFQAERRELADAIKCDSRA